MIGEHPKKGDHPKKDEPIPHDPRNEPIPTDKPNEGSRSAEKAEEKARKEEGVDMEQKERDFPKVLREDDVIVNPTDGDMPTGIQTGQTTRGSYSTDPSTGAGRYADHRAGKFGTEDVAQPGNDQSLEPDAIDPKL